MNIFSKLVIYDKGDSVIHKEENELGKQMKRKDSLKWTKLCKLLTNRFK